MTGHSVTLDATKADRLKEITGARTYKEAVDQVVTRFIGISAMKEARKNLDGKKANK